MTARIGDDDNPLDRWLSLEQACTRLNVAERTMYIMIADGRIAAIKHAGQLFVTPEEIGAYFARLHTESEQQRAAAEAARLARYPQHDHDSPVPR